MQPTKRQVEKSLAALHHEPPAPTASSVLSTSDGDEHVRRPYHDARTDLLDQLPPGVRESLEDAPQLRTDRLALARERLEQGHRCTADELADYIVGRLVCDRLR
jgi:hypothetical protein